MKLEVVKKDKESEENLSGAVYGLYAGEDICTGIVYDADKESGSFREEPEVLFAAGTLIATCITDSEGKAALTRISLCGSMRSGAEAPVGIIFV